MLTLDLHGVQSLLVLLSRIHQGQPASKDELDAVIEANRFFVDFYSGWDGCSRDIIRQSIQYFNQPELSPPGRIPARLAEGFRQAVSERDLLNSRLEWLSATDLSHVTERLLGMLPENTPLDAVIHITIDQVNNAFVDQAGMGISLLKGVADQKTLETVVSHELHHICFRYWRSRDAARQRLLDEHSGRSVAVLHIENLLMEGIANFYYSPDYVFTAAPAADPSNPLQVRMARLQREENLFFAQAEAVLSQCLEPVAAYDPCLEALKAIAMDMEDMMLPAGHYLGARMVQTMDQVHPRNRIVSSIQNLPDFLPLYNEAARKTRGYQFDEKLVDLFSKLWT
jgi:hypothetical protein